MTTNQNDTNRSEMLAEYQSGAKTWATMNVAERAEYRASISAEVPENLIPAYEAAGQAILANFHAPDDKHSTWWINLPEISSAVIAAVAPLIAAAARAENLAQKEN